MVRLFALVLLCFLSFSAAAQKEALYYFSNKDSTLVGVRTAKGKIVIPAAYHSYGIMPGERVRSHEIILWDTANTRPDEMHYSYSMKVFGRDGEFLYSPYILDNGPDYYVEGTRRFVENGKMGLADRNGKRLIEARYNYLEPSYAGYSLACIDCKYTRISNYDEHCCTYAGTHYEIIDRTGKSVFKFNDTANFHLDSTVLNTLHLVPNPVTMERYLIRILRNTPAIRQYAQDQLADIEKDYKAVILEQTKEGIHEVYMISFCALNGHYDNELCFLIKDDGKTIKHINSSGEVEPLSKWQK